MATTYSDNYQLKLIGSGLEAGTWGTSTNANLKLLEQMAGSKSEVTITSTANGSSWDSGDKRLTFVTQTSAAAGAGGSKGRSNYIEFDGSPGGASEVLVCGASSSQPVDRVFWVENGTGDNSTITVTGRTTGGNGVAIQPGARTLVYVTGVDAFNVLSHVQTGAIDFVSDGTGEIKIKDGTANALRILEGANEYVTADTAAMSVRIGASGSDCDTLDLDLPTIDTVTQDTKILVKNTGSDAFNITKGATVADESFLGFDSTANKLVLARGSNITTVDIDAATLDLQSQSTSVNLKTNDVDALVFKEGSLTDFVTLDTLTTGNKVNVAGNVTSTTLNSGATTLAGTLTINTANAINVAAQGTNLTIAASEANAFQINDGTRDLLEFNTSSDIIRIGRGSGDTGAPDHSLYLAVTEIDTTAAETPWRLNSNTTHALKFYDAEEEMLTFRTSNGSQRVEVGPEITGINDVALTVGNGLTVTAGNVTVSSGNVSVTGAVSASTTVSATTAVSAGTTVTAGTGLTVTANDATIANGDLVLGTNAKGVYIDDQSGTSARVMTLGADDQLAFGNDTTVDRIEFQCSQNAFKVQVASGALKNIWTDLSTELDSTVGAVDWKMATNANALEIKNAADATKFNFDTSTGNFTPSGAILAGASSTINGDLTVGGTGVSGDQGGQINLSAAATNNFTGPLVIDVFQKELRIFGGTPLEAGTKISFDTAAGSTTINENIGTVWGSTNLPAPNTAPSVEGTTGVSPTSNLNKKGGFNVGKVRFYFDTVKVAKGATEDVTPSGFVAIWTVQVVSTLDSHAAAALGIKANVKPGSATTIQIGNPASGSGTKDGYMSYFCVGEAS